MNKSTASQQTLDSMGRTGERFINKPKDIEMNPETAPSADTPHRAAAVRPRIADLLARIEGIQRWGLNE
jgi:hypothetical protein